MIQHFIQEFEHEVINTRKLLEAVPEKDLGYKPSPISWTMAELAQHIATIYYWYAGTLTQDVYDIAADYLERGDVNDIKATQALFESNVEKARTALKSVTEDDLQKKLDNESGG